MNGNANPLMPQGPSPNLPGQSPQGILGAAQAAHSQASAMFAQTGKAMSHIMNMGQELGALAAKGDVITPEDLIQTMGRLVADGAFSPGEAAGILSDMPTGGGQALAAWVQQHFQQNMQTAQQVSQAHNLARHEMGTSAMRVLQMHSLAGQASPVPELAAESPTGGTA
jgi:hypothetical protein